jgi:hypothetical protein
MPERLYRRECTEKYLFRLFFDTGPKGRFGLAPIANGPIAKEKSGLASGLFVFSVA